MAKAIAHDLKVESVLYNPSLPSLQYTEEVLDVLKKGARIVPKQALIPCFEGTRVAFSVSQPGLGAV